MKGVEVGVLKATLLPPTQFSARLMYVKVFNEDFEGRPFRRHFDIL